MPVIKPATRSSLHAALAILLLLAASAIGLTNLTFLYGDGANYLLKLLTSSDFVHIAPSRVFATFLTQFPTVIALKHYAPSINGVTAVYSLSLFAVPTMAHAWSLWLTRRDPLAFGLTVGVISISFITTMFVIVGEFHVFYSLAWLYAVIIATEQRDTMLNQALLALCAVVMIKSYEASAVVCPVLIVMTLAALRAARRSTEKLFLMILIVLLAAAVVIGVQNIIFPRDPGNAGGFTEALRKFATYGEQRTLFGLMLGGALLSLVHHVWLRLVGTTAIVALAFTVIPFNVVTGTVDVISTGSPNTQRAQALPYLLVFLGLLFLNWQLKWGRWTVTHVASCLPLLAPLVVSLIAFSADVQHWRSALQGVCGELEHPAGAAFYERPETRTFIWSWAAPSLGIIMRPPGSDAILHFPDHSGWMPFDPSTEAPDIEHYKRKGGLCPL